MSGCISSLRILTCKSKHPAKVFADADACRSDGGGDGVGSDGECGGDAICVCCTKQNILASLD